MALWVELHCDIDTADVCYNAQNHFGAMRFVQHARREMSRQVGRLEMDAHKAGWRQIAGRWYCPGCLKARETTRTP